MSNFASGTASPTAASESESAFGGLGGIVAAALIGLALVVAAGHVNASSIHAAAHDVRHSNALPCH